MARSEDFISMGFRSGHLGWSLIGGLWYLTGGKGKSEVITFDSCLYGVTYLLTLPFSKLCLYNELAFFRGGGIITGSADFFEFETKGEGTNGSY